MAALALMTAATCAVSRIESVNELNAAIHAGPLRAVGFLSQGNYDAIASILPKTVDEDGPLKVELFDDLDSLEEAVLSGAVLAGLSSSRPHNDDGLLTEFPASLVSMQAPMFRKSDGINEPSLDSQMLREAIDAAIVRAVHAGEYERLESKYFASNEFDSIAAFTCGINPERFPFPPPETATGLLAQVVSSKELRVGALGPSNWGYQGNYTQSNPTGFWPDYMRAIMEQFVKFYPGVTVTRVFNGTSDGVMEKVRSGEVHMSEIYWIVSGWFEGRARSEHFELGCTVLGQESIFFVKNPENGAGQRLLPWAVGIIVAGAVVLLLLCCFVCLMVQSERSGKPLFRRLNDSASKGVTITSSNQA